VILIVHLLVVIKTMYTAVGAAYNLQCVHGVKNAK